jgi:hypothetical protein
MAAQGLGVSGQVVVVSVQADWWMDCQPSAETCNPVTHPHPGGGAASAAAAVCGCRAARSSLRGRAIGIEPAPIHGALRCILAALRSPCTEIKTYWEARGAASIALTVWMRWLLICLRRHKHNAVLPRSIVWLASHQSERTCRPCCSLVVLAGEWVVSGDWWSPVTRVGDWWESMFLEQRKEFSCQKDEPIYAVQLTILGQ